MQVTDELKSQFVLFWAGPFSQWYKRDMVIEGITYNCCEQYMMAEKARTFHDEEMEQAIMMANSPSKQKAMGRNVRNYIDSEWQSKSRKAVFTANMAKFSQHADLLEMLSETGSKTIVEASPVDTIWGIGLAEGDSRCYFPDQWKGKNWLGIEIMNVRAAIKISG
jgi:ribA/ribD-fused uncharacterized protein